MDRFDYKLDLWRVGLVVRIDTCSPENFFTGRTNTCYIDILVCIQTDAVWRLGGDDGQVINVVEDLPTEWQEKYRDMCLKAGREPVEGKRRCIAPI